MVGFGAQMNPYLYATPNWGDVTEVNVRELEAKVVALRPQHVRIFFAAEWWNGKPDGISRDDPRMKASFLRTAALAQRAGATINITYWHGPWPEPARQAAAFADVIKALRETHRLTAVRYVTIQNEVNLHADRISMEKLDAIYHAFDARARAIGIRDDLQIIGGDLVQNDQAAWLAHLAEHQADVLDGYGVHMYWDYWDTPKLLRRVSEVPPIVAALPQRGRKPIFITEFGVRGKRDRPSNEPGIYEPDGRLISDAPVQAMQIAWFMMEAINRGYVATVQWDMYTAWYDRYMPYGMIGGVKEGWPTRPAYHVLRLFTHTSKPGWRAVKVEGGDAELLACALRGPEDETTAYVLNRSATGREVSLAGFPQNAALAQITWNGDGDGMLGNVAVPGSPTLVVPPGGLVAITTEQIAME
jgi:hypothetical protein